MTHPSVTVVIPFFQREAGILRRSLASVMAQTYKGPLQVFIVDDSSPVPADNEVREIEWPANTVVCVLRQPNAGPASARNKGLNARDSSSRYVAFLDSDDEWEPEHLSRAVTALSSGGSFYFSNFYQIDQQVGAFERAGRIRYADHRPLSGLDDAYFYVGDMQRQVLTGNLIGTPTVVFDIQRHKDIRFREEFFSAGEDYLCWLDFAAAGADFVFSSRHEVRCGRGVNVFSGVHWGTAEHLVRLRNELRYLRTARRIHALESDVDQQVKSRISTLRQTFLRSAMAHIRATRSVPWKTLFAQAVEDPAGFSSAPAELLASIVAKRTGAGPS